MYHGVPTLGWAAGESLDLIPTYYQEPHVITANCRANTYAFPALFDYLNE